MTGTVRKFDAKHGYGFITAAGGRNVFVHARMVYPDVNGHRLLYPGDEVEFELVETGRTPEANNTRILSPIAPAQLPVPREVGRVFFIHNENRCAWVSREPYCGVAVLLGKEIERLGGLQTGQWLEFQPMPPKTQARDGKTHWLASKCVAIETPLHTPELLEKCK